MLTKAKKQTWLQLQQIIEDKDRSWAELDRVYQEFDPHFVSVDNIGACFTPMSIASELGFVMDGLNGATVVDLCAGIGHLSYGLLEGWGVKKIIAVEVRPEYVAIGKKLLPQVEWVRGSIFDEKVLNSIGRADWVVSNPPFGQSQMFDPVSGIMSKLPSKSHYQAILSGLRIAPDLMFLLPSRSVPWEYSGRAFYRVDTSPSVDLKKFMSINSTVRMDCVSMDLSVFKKDWISGMTDIEMVHIHKSQQ